MLATLKRKLVSAVVRLKFAVIGSYKLLVNHCVTILTEKYWLLDYLPVFKKEQQALLLVRLDLIGDFILWLDSAQSYRKIYPNHRIVLAVNSACFELAQTLPHWDHVISIDVAKLRSNSLYRLRTLQFLRRNNFAIAIQPTFSRELVGDLAIRATNAKERIGYFGDHNNISADVKVVTDRWYSLLVGQNPSCVMELNKNAHFVRRLGDDSFLSGIPAIPPTHTLRSHLTINKPYIVVAPGASWEPKMWPASNFAGLITKLTSLYRVEIVLCGGTGDQAASDEIMRLIPQQRLTNFVGTTSLLEMCEIIRNAILLVSNDSAPIHIASATKTPSVCVLGGGHFGRFLPYAPERPTPSCKPVIAAEQMDCFGCKWRCTQKITKTATVPCIANVPVDLVYQACLQILDSSKQSKILNRQASTDHSYAE